MSGTGPLWREPTGAPTLGGGDAPADRGAEGPLLAGGRPGGGPALDSPALLSGCRDDEGGGALGGGTRAGVGEPGGRGEPPAGSGLVRPLPVVPKGFPPPPPSVGGGCGDAKPSGGGPEATGAGRAAPRSGEGPAPVGGATPGAAAAAGAVGATPGAAGAMVGDPEGAAAGCPVRRSVNGVAELPPGLLGGRNEFSLNIQKTRRVLPNHSKGP